MNRFGAINAIIDLNRGESPYCYLLSPIHPLVVVNLIIMHNNGCALNATYLANYICHYGIMTIIFFKYKFDLICFQINLIIIRRTQFLSLLSESQMDGRGNTESWIPQCYQNAYQIQIYLRRIMELGGIIKIECNFSGYNNFLPKKLLLILWKLNYYYGWKANGQEVRK